MIARPRRQLAALTAVAMCLLALTGCLTKEQQSSLDWLNATRKNNRVGAVAYHQAAQTKAQAWAEKMAKDGVLSHSNLRSGLPANCSVAENVGYGPTMASVHDAWMKSDGHRKNIVNGTYTGVGIGIANARGSVWTVHVFVRC